jgi:hypothetical protein
LKKFKFSSAFLEDIQDKPFETIGWALLGALSQYGIYWSIMYWLNISDHMATTYSVAGKMFSVLLLFASIGFIIIGFIILPSFWWELFKIIIIVIASLPEVVKKEIIIIKQIWKNRGFQKYKIFGGFIFYFHLRQRILAFLLAFISLGIITWFFAFKQQTYEKTYWKIKFYQNEPLQTFTFKPNIPYTIKTSAYMNSIFINFDEYVKMYDFAEVWNITFPDTTYINFNFYSAGINELFGQTLEVWENKAEGEKIYYPLSFRRKIR